MGKIGISLHDVIIPGVTVWREHNVEVVRYKLYRALDVLDEHGNRTHVDGFVFGILEHVAPGRGPAVAGYYTDETDAVSEAVAGLSQ